jgi:hypothetical protein
MPEFKAKVTLDNVEAKKDTGRALLCEIDGEEVWIPHSQIDDDSEVFKLGDVGRLVISEWIAKQKGLA